MFAECPIPSVVAHQIAAVVGATMDAYEAEQRAREAAGGVDWGRLGWDSQAQHDEVLAELAGLARSYPEPVQRHLRRVWRSKGFRTPLGLVDMDEWDRLVRSAPRVVDQDVAAETAPVVDESEVA